MNKQNKTKAEKDVNRKRTRKLVEIINNCNEQVGPN
jgi:hypothetical protein